MEQKSNMGAIALTIIITAVVVGGGVYSWQQANLQSTEQSLKQEIKDIKDQIANLQKTIQPIISETTATETTTNGETAPQPLPIATTPIPTPTPPIKPHSENPTQTVNSNNASQLSQSNEVTKIIQGISFYCEKYNIPKCLPITSYSIGHLDDKYSIVKIGELNYLLTKKNSEWSVSIASEENNICDTGSGNIDLLQYCNR